MSHISGSNILSNFSSAIQSRQIAVVAMIEPKDFAMCERALALGALNTCYKDTSPAGIIAHTQIAGACLDRDTSDKNDDAPTEVSS